jgi:ribonuclease E
MSDTQSETNTDAPASAAELAPHTESAQTTRRRRRVSVSSELDIDNDRVMTSEDVLDVAKEESQEQSATPSPESKASQASTPTGARKRTRRKAEDAPVAEMAPAKPVVPPKPTIGSTISAEAVANMKPAEEASGSNKRRRSRKSAQDKIVEAKQQSRKGKSKTAPKESKPLSHVDANLGVDEDYEIDPKTLKKRRGKLRKGKPTGRYSMYVHVDKRGHTQLAITEGRILTEHYVSRADIDDTMSIDGNIYLGRVQNVLPGMEAAFVDIATPKNAVLYRADVMYDHDKYKHQPPRIEESLKNGEMVLVQVTKNPIAHKGARLTQEVSLAGRFVVLIPKQPDTYGISKRLPDDERRRLRRILDEIRPADAGLIVRTAAEGATDEELRRDMQRLAQQWEEIKNVAAKAEKARTATLLYKEPPLVMRMIREEFNKEFRSIVIDDKVLYDEIRNYVESITPELAERVEYYDPTQELDLYERFHVTEQLTKALEKKVWLPSGGSLIIERTEALTVIDVNTGKNVGTSNLEETVYHNNLEAADEIARQLRLRDIGGIIVIDFIDMEIEKNRFELTNRLREALARDKTRTQVFEVTELGLVQMTRKRLSEGMVESFAEVCETCEGRGFVIDHDMVGGFAPVALASKAESGALTKDTESEN